MESYSIPDGYGVVPYDGTFYLVRGRFYSKHIPVEAMRKKPSSFDGMKSESGAFLEFSSYDDALLFAWIEWRKEHPEFSEN